MTLLALLGRLRGAPVMRDEALVRIKGGYRPDTIVARAGRPIRVTFRREESAACSERVLFPTLGKSAMLPPFEDVPLDLLVEKPGEHEFTCQMGMLRGRLIVRSDPDTPLGYPVKDEA